MIYIYNKTFLISLKAYETTCNNFGSCSQNPCSPSPQDSGLGYALWHRHRMPFPCEGSFTESLAWSEVCTNLDPVVKTKQEKPHEDFPSSWNSTYLNFIYLIKSIYFMYIIISFSRTVLAVPYCCKLHIKLDAPSHYLVGVPFLSMLNWWGLLVVRYCRFPWRIHGTDIFTYIMVPLKDPIGSMRLVYLPTSLP